MPRRISGTLSYPIIIKGEQERQAELLVRPATKGRKRGTIFSDPNCNPPLELSVREIEVLEQRRRGRTSPEFAGELGVSRGVARSYTASAIMRIAARYPKEFANVTGEERTRVAARILEERGWFDQDVKDQIHGHLKESS